MQAESRGPLRYLLSSSQYSTEARGRISGEDFGDGGGELTELAAAYHRAGFLAFLTTFLRPLLELDMFFYSLRSTINKPTFGLHCYVKKVSSAQYPHHVVYGGVAGHGITNLVAIHNSDTRESMLVIYILRELMGGHIGSSGSPYRVSLSDMAMMTTLLLSEMIWWKSSWAVLGGL